MTFAEYCRAEAARLRAIDYGPAREDREPPYCTMHPDDRPVLDKNISRLDLARRGRWPCCGAWHPGNHRSACRVHIADEMTPEQFLERHPGFV